jgi:SAM-dependent methyltransferase
VHSDPRNEVVVTSYVIRGGHEGKARMSVISRALECSTLALLGAAGLAPGICCLDLGCGGGDVSLAMARIVGPTGRVVGIDMDPVKMDLARRDATDAQLANVEFVTADATTLDADAAYDLVYARFCLTHLVEPAQTLERMVRAVRPGGKVVVEDLDHTAVFAVPRCRAIDEYVQIYNETCRRRGGHPDIGPELRTLFRAAGLEDVQISMVQPVFADGEAKHVHDITLANVTEAVLASGLMSATQLEALREQIVAFAHDPDTIVAFPRIYQVVGRRPLPPA